MANNNTSIPLTPLDIETLNEKVMTENELKAYKYFTAQEVKGGCFGKTKKDAPSDDEFDAMVADKLNEFGSKSKALKKIGLDISQVSEIEPIRFYGFEKYRNRLTGVYYQKIGDDGRWRSSVCSVTWLFFSNDQICMYNGKFDMFSGTKTEITEEYFYKDITNFTAETETEQSINMSMSKGGCIKKSKEQLDKKLTDYNTFGLIVPGDSFVCSVTGVANAEQIIEGMKQKLREKKIN
ncbi:MAG: hypothetical protein HDT28_09005 [Clostridiales bacterium]|nr:hypothetical protein [Clostridiales bacterium]